MTTPRSSRAVAFLGRAPDLPFTTCGCVSVAIRRLALRFACGAASFDYVVSDSEWVRSASPYGTDCKPRIETPSTAERSHFGAVLLIP